MILEEGLKEYLASSSVVAPYLSGRIYPQIVPQGGVLPALVYSRINADRILSHSGPTGVVPVTFQLSVYAQRYDQVKDAADAIRRSLQAVATDLGGVEVSRVSVGADRDAPFDEETATFGVHLEVEIEHTEV